MLYTVSTPDWKEAKTQQDIYLVSLQQGLPSTRQMTFTKEKNETSPRWAKDGRFFVFLSNRDAPESAATRNQLYLMRPDGGEARRITDAKEGVSDFAFSPDGESIAYRSGKAGEEQLYRLAVDALESPAPEQLTKHPTGISAGWKWSPDSRTIYFASPDTADARRQGAPREEVHRQHPQHGDARLAASGRSTSPRKSDEPADRGRRVLRRRLHDLGRRQVDRLQRRLDEPLRAQHHRLEPVRRSVPARHRAAARSSG